MEGEELKELKEGVEENRSVCCALGGELQGWGWVGERGKSCVGGRDKKVDNEELKEFKEDVEKCEHMFVVRVVGGGREVFPNEAHL